jgi:glycerophosphoryl diester phosphodiesterase
MTRDGRVVLSHDPTGERMAGVARAIRDCTLAEVRSWNVCGRQAGTHRMPTLDEALASFPGVVFNVDAKQTEPDMIPALLRAVRGAEDRVRIASFSAANLARVRAMGFSGETGLSPSEVVRALFAPLPALGWLRPLGAAAQVPRRAYGVRFASQKAIDRFHRLGLRVDFWTIDDPDEAAALFAMGADGVMTDDPRAILGQRSSWKMGSRLRT